MNYSNCDVNVLKLIMEYVDKFNKVKHYLKFRNCLKAIHIIYRNIQTSCNNSNIIILQILITNNIFHIKSIYCYCGEYLGCCQNKYKLYINEQYKVMCNKCIKKIYNWREIDKIMQYGSTTEKQIFYDYYDKQWDIEKGYGVMQL